MKPSPTTQETRALIIDAARRLLRHYGYQKTTVVDIAKACNMSAANVYRFFASKSAINETICHLVMSDLERDLHRISAESSSAALRLTQMVHRVAGFTTEIYSNDRQVHELVTAAVDENWDVIRHHIQSVRAIFSAVVEDGIAAGEFAPREPGSAARQVCFLLIGFWHPATAVQCAQLSDVPTPAEVAELLLVALKSDPVPVAAP